MMNKSKNLQALRSKEADAFVASLPPVISEDIWGEQTNEKSKQMNRMEKYARVEELKRKGQKSLAEYHEALQLCEDLGLDRAWQLFKRELEYRIEKAKQDAKLNKTHGLEPETTIYNRAYVDRLSLVRTFVANKQTKEMK